VVPAAPQTPRAAGLNPARSTTSSARTPRTPAPSRTIATETQSKIPRAPARSVPANWRRTAAPGMTRVAGHAPRTPRQNAPAPPKTSQNSRCRDIAPTFSERRRPTTASERRGPAAACGGPSTRAAAEGRGAIVGPKVTVLADAGRWKF
jgi:hypothetical protein